MSIHCIFISFFGTMYSYLHFYWRDLFGLADPSVENLNRNYKLLQGMQMLRVAITITSEILWFHPIFGELKFNPSKQDLCTYLLCQWTNYPSKQDICPKFGSNTTSPIIYLSQKTTTVSNNYNCTSLFIIFIFIVFVQVHFSNSSIDLCILAFAIRSSTFHRWVKNQQEVAINHLHHRKKRHYWICKHKAGLYSQYMTSKH